jgi:hypothetical protein
MTSEPTSRIDSAESSRRGTEDTQPRPDTAGRASRRRWIAVGVVAGLAVVAFVLWFFQPQALFIDDVVDEEFPVGAGAGEDHDAAAADDEADGTVASSPQDEEPAAGADAPTATDAVDRSPGDTDGGDDSRDAGSSAGSEAGSQLDPSEPIALVTGQFSSRNRYEVTGTATVFALDDTERILRLEDFESTNGPDLFVYLTAADASAEDPEFDADFVDLGVLTGNIGNQNYVIPPDVDLDVHDTVVIWCRRFTSSFGVADLAPATG